MKKLSEQEIGKQVDNVIGFIKEAFNVDGEVTTTGKECVIIQNDGSRSNGITFVANDKTRGVFMVTLTNPKPEEDGDVKIDPDNPPEFFYRPSDFTIFARMKDGKYWIRDHVDKDYTGHSYDLHTLVHHEFVPCTEKDLPEIEEKHSLYREFVNWSTRSDGHGGSKGGTWEEFLAKKAN